MVLQDQMRVAKLKGAYNSLIALTFFECETNQKDIMAWDLLMWSNYVHPLGIKCTLGNFQKFFRSPYMAAILNFRIFAQNGKTQICFYLLNHAKWSYFVEIFDP